MRDIERKIVEAITQGLNFEADALRGRGISWTGPEIDVWEPSDEKYTSELKLTILRKGCIDDMIEFHIFRNGELQITPEEAKEWFRTQLSSL
jgi:hypothetical protein